MGINSSTIAVSLYKIGSLVGVRDIEKHEDVAGELEQALKSFTEMEVLPARILLYGSDPEELEDVKNKLMHHPWTTKANFLHFPKIEIVSSEVIIDAISMAGASEMGKKQIEEPLEAEVQAPEPPKEETSEANVMMVDAESLGFKKDADVLEEEEQKAVVAPEKTKITAQAVIGRGKLVFDSAMRFIREFVASIKIPQKLPVAGVAIGVVVLSIAGVSIWSLPKAAVTVLTISKTVTASQTITIDPEASAVDNENNVVPGRSREQSVSGEKTVAVVGKKNIGDPARGTVTLYNKSLSTRTFSKGTVLSSGSLKFTLDADVEVASASESIGSIMFGKKDASVTAAAIGTQSNLAAGGEFTFADISSSVAIARNEAALTGGTSREVTVVSRADVDNFIKDVSGELTKKAQEQLATSVSGGEQMIEGTIKTTLKERIFDKEIDEEATQLNGKLTIVVSGVTYSQADIRSLLVSSGLLVVPEGYTSDEVNSTTTLSQVQVKKDGTITARVTMEASLAPTIDIAALPKALAGKSIKDAELYLRGIPGVGGMEVGLRFSPMKNRLPINRNNISVSVSTVQ